MGPEFSKTIDLETAGGVMIGTPLNGGLSNHAKRNLPLYRWNPVRWCTVTIAGIYRRKSGEFFVQVWGNGANFDNTIFAVHTNGRGSPARGVTTTIASTHNRWAGESHRLRCQNGYSFEGERHNALDDARYQAKYVSLSGKNWSRVRLILNVQLSPVWLVFCNRRSSDVRDKEIDEEVIMIVSPGKWVSEEQLIALKE